MLESKLVDNFLNYQNTAFMGMTGRQLFLSIIGVILIAVSYFFVGPQLGTQAGSYLAMATGLPFFIFAFFRPKRMPLEKYMEIVLKDTILSPRFLPYETDNGLIRHFWYGERSPLMVDVVLGCVKAKSKQGIEGVEIVIQMARKKKNRTEYIDIAVGMSDISGAWQIPDLLPGAYRWFVVGVPDGYALPKKKQVMYFKVLTGGKLKGAFAFMLRPVAEVTPAPPKMKKVHKPAPQAKAQSPVMGTIVKDQSGNVLGVLITNNKGETVVVPLEHESEDK